MTKEDLCARLRAIRDYYKLNQTQFSTEIGMSQSEYSKIELGKVIPSKTLLYAMMARLAINPEWVITGQGDMLLSAEEYFNNGIKLLGVQKISEGLVKILKDPAFGELQSLVTAQELVKDKLDPDLAAYFQYIFNRWQQGDENIRGWLKVQMDSVSKGK